MASSKVLRTGSSSTTPVPYMKRLNGQNGTTVHIILTLEAARYRLVLPQRSSDSASNHSGVVSRYQVPDPSTIHHLSPYPSGQASRPTKEDHRATKLSRILLDSLGSVISVVGLATRPRNAR